MATVEAATAVVAIDAVLAALTDAGIPATKDAGSFYPAPVGVLVGLPALTKRGLTSATFSVPVTVVSGDPLTDETKVARLYALADDTAVALRCDQYRPTSWSGGVNSEPLPAVELAAKVTLAAGSAAVQRED